MTGNQLWKIFLDAQVPDQELIALGTDIGHKHEQASPATQKALLKICAFAASLNENKILFAPSKLYHELKFWMPGGNPFTVKEIRRKLLEAVADFYGRKISYEQTSGDVQKFFSDVACRLPPIPEKMAQAS